jgi:ribosome-interacting GTPase 1
MVSFAYRAALVCPLDETLMIVSFSSLYVYNKIDSVSLDFLDKLAREPHTCVMSCELDLGLQDVVERSWQELQLMRIYTKRYVKVHLKPYSITYLDRVF